MHRPSFQLRFALLVAALLAGCSLPGRLSSPAVTPAKIDVKTALAYNRLEVDKLKRVRGARHVVIQAQDIQLPPTPRDDEASNTRLYTFDIWADASEFAPNANLKDILFKDLDVEVMGVPATVTAADYKVTGAAADQPSKSVVHVTISSDKLSGPFTIVAWFPDRYRQYEDSRNAQLTALRSELRKAMEAAPAVKGTPAALAQEQDQADLEDRITAELEQENPWGERKQVHVYSGDLKAQIFMAGDDEVKSIFGPQFAKFFYVGRVFLRNQDPERRLFVYTTSLRANALFYRSKDKALAKELAKEQVNRVARLRELDGRVAAQLNRVATSNTSTGLTAAEVTKIVQIARMGYGKPTASVVSDIESREIGVPYNAPKRKQIEDIVQDVQKLVGDLIADAQKKTPTTPALKGLTLSTVKSNLLADAVQNTVDDTDPEIRGAVHAIEDEVQRQIVSAYLAHSPLSQPVDLLVNPSNRALAYSYDSDRQASLASFGYVWRDQYRPMTFQSVLNSLVTTTDGSGWKQWMDIFQSLGVVAGGLVNATSIGKDLGTRSYVESVAFTTAVLLPEARKLLVDDVNKYVRNLGDLGMDTVVAIEPNGVTDRYIFFPRGPIFGYGIDEFHPTDPSFIVQINNDDVAVEAVLVDRSKSVSTGMGQTSDQLTEKAINAGTAQRDADAARLVALNERMRSLRLNALTSEVEKLMASDDPNKKAEAGSRMRSFEAVFGADSSGALAHLGVKHGIPGYGGVQNYAPSISYSGASPVELREGATDPTTIGVDVNDAETNAELLTVTTSITPDKADAATVAPVAATEKSAQRKFTLTPAADKFGDLTVKFTVEDKDHAKAEVSVPVRVKADRPRLEADATLTLKPEETKTVTVKLTDPRKETDLAFRLVAEQAPPDLLTKVDLKTDSSADGVTTFKITLTAGKAETEAGKPIQLKLHATNTLRTTPDKVIAIDIKK